MDLDKIAEVAETIDEREVNQMLADGWVLLAVASGTDEYRAYIRYSLGFPREE